MTTSFIDEAIDQELFLAEMEAISGGFFGLLKSFGKAVIEGAREIETTQETGTLPNRFWTPVTDVGGASDGGSPGSSECTLNNGDYGRHY